MELQPLAWCRTALSYLKNTTTLDMYVYDTCGRRSTTTTSTNNTYLTTNQATLVHQGRCH